jgi:hypothetical protein
MINLVNIYRYNQNLKFKSLFTKKNFIFKLKKKRRKVKKMRIIVKNVETGVSKTFDNVEEDWKVGQLKKLAKKDFEVGKVKC